MNILAFAIIGVRKDAPIMKVTLKIARKTIFATFSWEKIAPNAIFVKIDYLRTFDRVRARASAESLARPSDTYP